MRLFIVSYLLVQMVCLNNALARPSMTGQAVANVGDVGEHYPLFLVEKSHHPGNIIVVYTKLDTNCHVIPDREHGFLPTLEFYWLMDATHYKPMARPLKAAMTENVKHFRELIRRVRQATYDGTSANLRNNRCPKLQRFGSGAPGQ